MKTYLENASYDWSEDSIRFIYTANQFIKKTLFYIQEAGYFKTTDSYYTERENLDSFLIVYTLSGSGLLEMDDTTYPIEPHQLFFIPCMKHHYYCCRKDKEWEFLWIHFNGIAARGYYEKYSTSQTPVITIDPQAGIPEQMRQVLSLIQKKELNRDYMISNILTNILTQLILTQSQGDESPFLPDYLIQTIKYIDQHFKEEISLDQLSKEIGISKFYLLKQFKKYFETTIREYQIVTRLNYAKELLKYTDTPVHDISDACGINQTSHFIHLFKKHECLTPLQYRNKWK
ncbi:MAG: AraC family transcriptional regulator [Hespellia sp.]|nr:AraC family transcriptional regulator [Hespellia sp.]